MHELSIAMNIIDIASEQAKINNFATIDEVEIEIGTLSGVEIEALKFAMEIATKNTILENAIIKIIKIISKAHCLNCSNEFETDNLFAQCPECNQLNFQIIQGLELVVKSISVY